MSARSTPLDDPPPPPPPPKAYLLLENEKKSNNLGPILRCACAYGISTILAIGYSKCSALGAHGANKFVEIIAFPTIAQAVASLRADGEKTVSIVGILGGLSIPTNNFTDSFPVMDDASSGLVQILKQLQHNTCSNLRLQQQQDSSSSSTVLENVRSFPIFDHSRAFEAGKDHCFVLCKSKKGLTSFLASICDRFVHVPCADIMVGGDGLVASSSSSDPSPPLLDVPSCLSITLHHFTEFAQYDERTFQGHKFELVRRNYEEERKKSSTCSGDCSSTTTKEGEMGERVAVDDEDILDSLAGVFNNESSDY